jgi:hypothetical protein
MLVAWPRFLSQELAPIYWRGLRAEAWALICGAAAYLLVHIFMHRPITAYVFSHELTHAIWARLTGHRVRSIRAGREGGATVTDGSNFIVRLAPYCMPLYAVVWILGWNAVLLARPDLDPRLTILYGGIGFTYAFHVLLTLHFIKVGQSDLHAEGYCFSLALILAVNLEVAAAALAAVSHRASWLGFQLQVWEILRDWAARAGLP